MVILYVHTIRQSSLSLPEDNYQPYLKAATRCQDQIHNIAEEGSLSARYCMVLEELRIEAMKQLQRVPTFSTNIQDNWDVNEVAGDRGPLIVSNGRPLSGSLLSPPELSSGENFVGFDQNTSGSPEDMMAGAFNSIVSNPNFRSPMAKLLIGGNLASKWLW